MNGWEAVTLVAAIISLAGYFCSKRRMEVEEKRIEKSHPCFKCGHCGAWNEDK